MLEILKYIYSSWEIFLCTIILIGSVGYALQGIITINHYHGRNNDTPENK